jgi:hypothetical protein
MFIGCTKKLKVSVKNTQDQTSWRVVQMHCRNPKTYFINDWDVHEFLQESEIQRSHEFCSDLRKKLFVENVTENTRRMV